MRSRDQDPIIRHRIKILTSITRPPSRRIRRRPEKKYGLAAGKIAASRQLGRKKYAAKPPQNFRLRAASLPRDVNEKLTLTVQSSYDHAVSYSAAPRSGRARR